MTNRCTLSFSIIAAALLALSLPVITAAQGSYGYPDYRRDRDRDYDDYGRNRRYDGRYLRDSIRQLDRLSADFSRDLDRRLDHSRIDGTRLDHLFTIPLVVQKNLTVAKVMRENDTLRQELEKTLRDLKDKNAQLEGSLQRWPQSGQKHERSP